MVENFSLTDVGVMKPWTPSRKTFSNIVRCVSYCYDVTVPASFKPFPNAKISDLTKLKAFADDKLNVAKRMISLFDRVENTVEKGENAGYQHFLLFPQCFPKPSPLGSLKVGIVW